MRNYLNRYDFEYFEKDIFNYVDMEYLERLTALSLGMVDFDLSVKKIKYENVRNETPILNSTNFSVVNDALRLNYNITNQQQFKIVLKKNNEIVFETTKPLINLYLNALLKNNLSVELQGATLSNLYEFNSKANFLVIYKTFEILFNSYQFKNQDIWFLKSESYKKNFYELFSEVVQEYNLKIKEAIR